MEQQMRALIDAAKAYQEAHSYRDPDVDERAFETVISAASSALEHSGSEYAGNLLAVIHGDGGHYIGKHGWKKATDDAIKTYYALRAISVFLEEESPQSNKWEWRKKRADLLKALHEVETFRSELPKSEA